MMFKNSLSLPIAVGPVLHCDFLLNLKWSSLNIYLTYLCNVVVITDKALIV